jgi:hypothetical protein
LCAEFRVDVLASSEFGVGNAALLKFYCFAAKLGGQRAQDIDAAAFGDVETVTSANEPAADLNGSIPTSTKSSLPFSQRQHTTRPVPSGCTIGVVRNRPSNP